MGREFELKYAADAGQLEAIRGEYPDVSPITMETVYYDTPSGMLGKLRWTLRRRYENGVSVCTLKTPLRENGARGEWEVNCPDITLAAGPLVEAGAPEGLEDWFSEGLIPTCGARFTRLAGRILYNGAVLELALDQGVLLGGGRELPFAEVEVELKDGPDAAAVAFAQALAEKYGLVPQEKSKFRRAKALADKQASD